ncbi:F-box protein At3g07870-like [Apium graveolens]|uniref:F-box protein At3g07870-like n=1 Tax=Apium graveolens TaxID=4045 RepID=UPI003D792452
MGFDSLPHEIALGIFSRLSITSLMQSRFVCRSWQNLSLDRNLVSLHLSRVAERDPLLIFHSDFPIRNQLCFAELSDTDDGVNAIVKKINIPFSASMPEFIVVGSCNGLLCLRDSLFKSPQNSKSEVSVLGLGGNTWRNLGLVPYYIERRSQGALFTRGRLHWQTRCMYNDRGLIKISFDLSDEKFYRIKGPDFSSVADDRTYHLANLKGCLSAVVYKFGYEELEIWVLKEYNVKESWVRDFKIGANIPESPSTKLHLQQPLRIWRNTYNRVLVRVLCILRNGEILIEYKVGKLALYDVASGRYKDLNFKGMPSIFQTVVHFGSLNQIDLPAKN